MHPSLDLSEHSLPIETTKKFFLKSVESEVLFCLKIERRNKSKALFVLVPFVVIFFLSPLCIDNVQTPKEETVLEVNEAKWVDCNVTAKLKHSPP